MKIAIGNLIAVAFSVFSQAEAASQDISQDQLQTVINLPLNQAVKQRETYKVPLKAAYDRQIAMASKDCQAESDKGQQPYNICLGHADEQADQDFAIFYKSLQMLCHSPDELTAFNPPIKHG